MDLKENSPKWTQIIKTGLSNSKVNDLSIVVVGISWLKFIFTQFVENNMGLQSNRINKMEQWMDESQKHYTEWKKPGMKE